MRVIQTIASTRIEHGGTSRSIPSVCNALSELNVDNYLLTQATRGCLHESILPYDTSRVVVVESDHYSRFFQRRRFEDQLGQIVSLPGGMREGLLLVHDHGVWLPTNHAVARLCRKRGFTRIVSPRGMLGKWALAHGKWKKRLAWILYQARDLKSVTAFHATSDQEAWEIRQLGLIQPIAVVPNGLEFPEVLPQRSAEDGFEALFLSRIHPKKGLINLLRAWQRAELPREWKLRIVGPDECNHLVELQKEANRLGISGQVRFDGPVSDSAKWQLYVNADLFVLPTFNENFGIVIAEAMAAGLPVITTTGTPWSVLRERNLGWYVEPQVEQLAHALAEASGVCPESRIAMGRAASEYVRSVFSWNKAATQLLAFYNWILDSGPRPDFVR